MNWDQIEGNWKQAVGEAKKQWGRFSRDQLMELGGSKDRLVGKIQELYGVTRDEAERQVNEWQVAAFDEVGGPFAGASRSFAERAFEPGQETEPVRSPAADAAAEWWHDARRTLDRGVDVLGAFAEERPFVTLGCALAIGVVLGFAMRRR